MGATRGKNLNALRRILETLEYNKVCLDLLHVAVTTPSRYPIQHNELKARHDRVWAYYYRRSANSYTFYNQIC